MNDISPDNNSLILKNQYLDYIRVLHKRSSDYAQKNGFTIWAIIISLIYLMWNSIPLIDEIRGNKENIYTVALYYSYIHMAMLSFYVLIDLESPAKKKPLDYRILRSPSIMNIITILFIGVFLPQEAGFFVHEKLKVLSSINSFQSQVNFYLVLGSCSSVLVLLILEKRYQKKTGFVNPMFFTTSPSNWLLELIFIFMLLELFLCNTYLVINFLLTSANTDYSKIITTSLNLSLLSLGLAYLPFLLRSEKRLTHLERLERDIILHDIDNGDIRRRLEEEYLGQAIGEWLNVRIQEAYGKANVVIDHLKGTDDFIQELTVIDHSMKYELEGRVTNFINKLCEKQSNYYQKASKITKWLNDALEMQSIKYDDYLFNLLKGTAKNMKEIHENIDINFKENIEKVKQIANELKIEFETELKSAIEKAKGD